MNSILSRRVIATRSITGTIRAIHAPATSTFKIPAQSKSISTPLDFFTQLSRPALIPFAAKIESWDQLFNPALDLTALGMSVQERRYTKWSLQKFRQGHVIADIAIIPKPKKKIRGWGPAVQNGIRVR